jgi:hypothetical protein
MNKHLAYGVFALLGPIWGGNFIFMKSATQRISKLAWITTGGKRSEVFHGVAFHPTRT